MTFALAASYNAIVHTDVIDPSCHPVARERLGFVDCSEVAVPRFRMLKRLFLALLLLQFATAFAQEYPNKTIRLIVPNPPGGSTDLVARRLAAGLATELGQSVVVDNRGGASGMVGAQVAMNAPPDGYTLLFAPTSVMAINPAVFAKLPYDPLENFAPVSLLSKQPLLIAVTPSLPANTLSELIALA